MTRGVASRILIVDDASFMRNVLKDIIKSNGLASEIFEARAILKIDPLAKVIMITSVEEKHIVQDAIKLGARDYVVKPFDRSNVPLVINKVIRQQ
jgi:two-component system chemotaxis response regulator CheY